jgi:pimeloyl-ACP methyl ester carboxylesterase
VAHFDHGAATQLSLMGLPGAMILKPGLRIAELILREKFATIAPAFSIARLNCPVLAILPQDDAFLPPTAATELRSAIETRADRDAISRALTFPATAHLQPLTVAKTRYTQELSAFLHEAATSLDSRRAENTVRNSPGA